MTKLGMSEGRFRIEWISAAEGDKYSRVINEMQQTINDIGMQQILAENATMRPELEKRSRRMYEVPMVPEASTYSDQMAIAMSVTEVKDGK